MSRLSRSSPNRQIWITHGQLAALGTATLFIAALAFLVGLQVGRSGGRPEVAQAPDDPLVADPTDDDTLEALLSEVEHAQAVVGPDGVPAADDPLDFTETLAQTDAPPVPVEEAPSLTNTEDEATLAEPATDRHPVPPETPADGLPESGWAVQVGSYPTAPEADSHIAEFRERGYAAYRVGALVDGRTWYRVRIGGYQSRESADDARQELMSLLGDPHLLVAEAP